MKVLHLFVFFVFTMVCYAVRGQNENVLSNNHILINDNFYGSIKEKIDTAKETYIENEKNIFKEKYGPDSTQNQMLYHNYAIDPELINVLKKIKYLKNKSFRSIEVIEMTISGERVTDEFYILFNRKIEEGSSAILKLTAHAKGYNKDFLVKNFYGFKYELFTEFVLGIKNNFDIKCIQGVYGMKIHFTTISKGKEVIAKSKVVENPCNLHFEILEKFFLNNVEK